jgi:hypothetical protein
MPVIIILLLLFFGFACGYRLRSEIALGKELLWDDRQNYIRILVRENYELRRRLQLKDRGPYR